MADTKKSCENGFNSIKSGSSEMSKLYAMTDIGYLLKICKIVNEIPGLKLRQTAEGSRQKILAVQDSY
jgi:hypothetical protein